MKTEKQTGAGKTTSRRRFAKNIASALVTAPLAVSLAQAQTPTTPKEATAPPNPQPTPITPKPTPLAEAYSEVARARFGEHVTAEQLAKIKEDMEGNVRTAERLRRVKLQNGDEPDFVFEA